MIQRIMSKRASSVCTKPQGATIKHIHKGFGRNDKYLYHLTDLNNMESIITRGLLSRAQLQNTEVGFVDVADPGIIDKRGDLDHFVPFHFVPNTPFDYVVKRDHKDKQFVYICVSRDYARSKKSYILLSHPTSNYVPDPCTFDDGIKALDWEAIEDPYAFMDPQRKQNKMAECIIREPISAEDFAAIFVPNEAAANRIYALYEKHGVSCSETSFMIDYQML